MKIKIKPKLITLSIIFLIFCSLKVNAIEPSISATTKIINVGKNTSLNIVGTNQKVIWSSSNKNIATVSSKGKVKGIKAGTCTIKAKVDGKTYKCKVTIKDTSSTTPTNPTETNTMSVAEVQAKMEAACRAHGMVSYEEALKQSLNDGELTLDEYNELLGCKYDASWVQCSIPINNNFSNEDYYAYGGMNSPAYTIVYDRTDSGYYIFTCYYY